MTLLVENNIANIKLLDKKTIPFYRTSLGSAYLGDSLELMKKLPDNSVNLVLTSPPFALTSKKEYRNEAEDKYVDCFLQFS